MKLCLSAASALVLVLAAPVAASAATLAPDPAKPCYRSGEKINLRGTGFTPNVPNGVNVDRDGQSLGPVSTDAEGAFTGVLTLGQDSGIRTSTYTAIDTTNSLLTAAASLRVSAVDVNVKPEGGRPGRVVTIGATGFTTGKKLWVHVRKGGFKRDFRIGTLKGDCRRLKVKRRILSPDAAFGVYTVQFDTFRRYRESRAARAVFTITVRRILRPSAATAAGAVGWSRVY